MNHGDQSYSTASEESVIDDLKDLTESDDASTTEYIYDRSRIEEPGISGDGAESGDDSERNQIKRKSLRLKKKKLKASYDASKRGTVDSHIPRAKKDSTKKVQVATEETGQQRVQVNAGYENPEIPCLQQGCSGVLLKWVVTFFGTDYWNS